MSIFSKVRNALGEKKVSGVELMTEVGNNYMSWNGTVYNSDIVRACIRPKVKAVGKLMGKHILETTDEDGNKKITTNPRNWVRFLLEEPNPLMSGQQFLEKMTTQLCINSNAFALMLRDEMGTPTALYPIIPRRAEAVYASDGALQLKFTLPNNKIYTFAYEDVIHLRQDFNENDVFGTPIAPALTPLLEVVTTTDQGVINAIKNSSVIRWLLKFSGAIRKEDLRDNAKEFAENFLNTSKGTGVAATDSKADAVQISPNDYVPNASQMDRTTKRIFDLLNTNEKIVSSSATGDEYSAYFDAEVEPIEIQLNNEYTRKIFTRRERSFGNRIVFEANAWDSASFATKLSLQAMVDRGAMTPNEWRATMNLAPINGGDEPIRRLDTATVEIEEEGDE